MGWTWFLLETPLSGEFSDSGHFPRRRGPVRATSTVGDEKGMACSGGGFGEGMGRDDTRCSTESMEKILKVLGLWFPFGLGVVTCMAFTLREALSMASSSSKVIASWKLPVVCLLVSQVFTYAIDLRVHAWVSHYGF